MVKPSQTEINLPPKILSTSTSIEIDHSANTSTFMRSSS